MRRKQSTVIGIILCCLLLIGCSSSHISEDATALTQSEIDTQESDFFEEERAVLPDGKYWAEFDTDSSMFRVNEAYEDKGILTVENGKMIIHISLGSKNILNLYPGLAKDAKKEGAVLLKPTEDTVTYSDGWTSVVYGFDVPVPVLEEEFDLALIGKKGKWYDHKVSVSNPQPMDSVNIQEKETKDIVAKLEEGSYTIEILFEGGSGRARVLSPVNVKVVQGIAMATICWDSPYYDYMIVNGEKYMPINESGNSVFEIPILKFDEPFDVIGDTVAMSRPHEIEYWITFCSDTIKLAE